MHLLDCIETQLVSNRLPLVAVTRCRRPLREYAGGAHAALARVRRDAPRGRHRRQRRRLPAGAQLRAAAERALGPLRPARERRARRRLGARLLGSRAHRGAALRAARRDREQESLACMGAFGSPAADASTASRRRGRSARMPTTSSRPPRAPVTCSGFSVPCAAASGPSVAEDLTLEEGGYRNPPCPILCAPTRPGRSRRVVYQFGRSDRLVSWPSPRRDSSSARGIRCGCRRLRHAAARARDARRRAAISRCSSTARAGP